MALISAPAPEPDPVPGGGSLDSAGELETALGAVIAQRLRDYRLQLGLSVTQLATSSGLSKGMLSKIENAQAAPSLGTLARLSAALNVPVTAFFRGLDEERDVFHVRAGQGMELSDRSRGGHRYQLLGTMRGPSKRMEPLLVTLMERAEVFPLYQHPGTEFLFQISGCMEYGVGNGRYRLEPGDSLQFDGEVTHGPVALVTLPVQFLTVKAYGHVPG